MTKAAALKILKRNMKALPAKYKHEPYTLFLSQELHKALADEIRKLPDNLTVKVMR